MALNIDLHKILKTFDTINQELSESFQEQHSLSLKDAQNQLGMREVQLKTVLEISKKLILQFDSTQSPPPPKPQSDLTALKDLTQKFSNLQRLYDYSELLLAQYKAENESLKLENEKILSYKGTNNLFTVEVYQSEIEDLKKDYSEKMEEFQCNFYLGKIQKLESSHLNKKYVELQKKYCYLKEQVIEFKKRVMELEEIVVKNNEHRKVTESKYFELVNTHKKMFGYIEKLEVKVRKFQEKHRMRESCSLSALSRENSLSFYSRITDEGRSFTLSISGPIAIFSV